MKLEKKFGYLFIIAAGTLWGFLGFSCKILVGYGLVSFDVSFFRLFVASILLLLYFVFKDINLLKIDRKGLLFTALIGLVSQALANGFYFYAIDKTTITTAVILLYTAPIFTNIISVFIYNESFTRLKAFSIFLCVIGVFFTSTGGDIGTLKFNSTGLVVGLSAGFTFGLMPILNKSIMGKYNPWTILFYSFLWGSLFLLPVARPLKIFSLELDFYFWLTLLFLGLILSTFAYGLYLKGLSLGVEPSRATILSTIEIVVSVLIASFIFSESINAYNMMGVLMVAISAVLIQKNNASICVVKNDHRSSKIPL